MPALPLSNKQKNSYHMNAIKQTEGSIKAQFNIKLKRT